jgi:hypothetical protein
MTVLFELLVGMSILWIAWLIYSYFDIDNEE